MKQELDRLHNKIKKTQRSGVILKDYYPLKFSEHIWANTPEIYSEGKKHYWKYDSDEMLSLVNMVVKVDDIDAYFLKNKYGKGWEIFKSKNGLHDKLFNDYQGFEYESINPAINKLYYNNPDKSALLIYGKVSRKDDDTEYEVRGGTIPSVYTTVDYPMHPEFLCADTGHFVLNFGSTYESLSGVADFKKSGQILRMIYRNLCNYPAMVDEDDKELTDEEECFILYQKVLDNTYTPEDKDFKFVVNWCASLVQTPGINLMTNIWFAGEYQGIGKGTLVNLMKAILGKKKVGRCKPNMILGNFNGELDGIFILEINEKQQNVSPAEMTNWLKGFSQEDDLQIEKKGKEVFTRLNTVNVIGTAQTPEDVFKIEDEDRRNVIFRTVSAESDPSKRWRKYAKKIATGLKYEAGWAESFAWILERIDIDTQLMETAYQTNGYAEVKTEQVTAQNPVYLWAQDTFIEMSKQGKKIKASELFEIFLEDNPRTNIKTQNTFNKKLKELEGLEGLGEFKLTKPQNILTIDILKGSN